jgi:hypothetical protein
MHTNTHPGAKPHPHTNIHPDAKRLADRLPSTNQHANASCQPGHSTPAGRITMDRGRRIGGSRRVGSPFASDNPREEESLKKTGNA